MIEPIIKVENLSKRYRIGAREEGYKTFREAIMDTLTAPIRNFQRLRKLTKFDDNPRSLPSAPCPMPHAPSPLPHAPNPMPSALSSMQSSQSDDIIWALRDVSFEVKQGEVVGIIGRNGAGKTTLLKILSRITEPTTGDVKLYGRVSSLLEVGTGFHPELTGRENIFLNGAILGMRKTEIDRKFDEIVAFAEIEKFLDTPVKRYSSGMYVRLAFAVAAHLEPEILLVDEVLAVGDAAFQKKCLGKMGDVAKEGRTVLFVSHNMGAVENLCGRALLLENGSIIQEGESKSVVHYYLAKVLPSTIEKIPLANRRNRSGNGKVKLTSFHVEDTRGNKLKTVRSGMDVVFVFGFRCQDRETLRNVDMGFSLHSDKDQTLFVLYSSYVGRTFETIPPAGFFRCYVPNFPFSGGRYRVGARVTVGREEADWPRDGIAYLDVEDGDFYGTGRKGFEGNAPLLIDGEWSVKSRNGGYQEHNEHHQQAT